MNAAQTPEASAAPPRHFNGLLVALAATLVAGLFRWSLDPFIGMRAPFATFFIARHLHPDDAARVQMQLRQAMRPGGRPVRG